MKISGIKVALLGLALGLVSSCTYEKSQVTGWDYNNPMNGGFEKRPYEEQETGPGLILIEGGTFTMGQVEQDVMYEHHNTPRRVTVSSFYLDETEVSNHHWCEYLYWLDRTFSPDFTQIYKKALPDTLIWREKLAYNEPYVDYYLRHPSYRDYPVVGVSWLQANDFCQWRTDRVNEYILIREGILVMNPMQQNEPFTTESYFAGQYDLGTNPAGQMPDLNPTMGGYDPTTGKFKSKDMATRIVRMEDGILLPRYRLPTEAEWEFAAYGLIGNSVDERIVERRIYPWNGHWVRNAEDKWQGDMMANFVRGAGDYMGVSGHLNDNADVTAPVYSYWPNDYGLYNMAGNVSEWVMDVYRPQSSEDFDEFRPFRGNVFTTKTVKSDGAYANKYEEVIYDLAGMKQYIEEFTQERFESGSINRTFGYVTGNRMDSIEMALINEIKVILDEAQEMKDRKQDIESSIKIRTIFDDLFEDFNTRVQSEDPLPGVDYGNGNIDWSEYEVEIIPMLRVGLSEFELNTPGNMQNRQVTAEENIGRRNYRVADNIDYLDGDLKSSIAYPGPSENNAKLAQFQNKELNEDWAMYQAGLEPAISSQPTTLITDKSRVYKGGSWRDRAYWMNPGTRRYLEEDMCAAYLGFRCAMDRVGSPTGLGGR